MSNQKTTAVSRYNVIATFGGGRAGNVRLVNKGQRTYIRAAHNSVVNNPQTVRQMKTRLMFASRSQYWELLKPIVDGCMSGVTRSVSNANLFNRLNKQVGCYFTKEEMQYKPSVIMPVTITNGQLGSLTLTEITTSMTGRYNYMVEELKYNLNQNPLYTETVSAISRNLLANNKWLKEGDKITAMILTNNNDQTGPDGNKIPRVEVSYYGEMTIDTQAGGIYCQITFMQGANASGSSATNLGFDPTYLIKGNTAVAVIVSRNENGKRLCTTSKVSAPVFTQYDEHKTGDALYKARLSYAKEEKELGSANADTLYNINWVLEFATGTTDTHKKWIEDNMPKRLPGGLQTIDINNYIGDYGAKFNEFEGETFSSDTFSVRVDVKDDMTLHAKMEYWEN